jgi:ribonucleoside-diphosphate reductase alpha chain
VSTGLIAADGTITDPYRQFIAVSRYARWLDSAGRRETWSETVTRYVDFFREHLVEGHGYDPLDPTFHEVHEAILNHRVMPSMRALMTAGPALKRSHIAGYNCSFIAVDDPRAFDEAMYILLNGTGVGFSVEARHVEKLPHVPAAFWASKTTITVQDSKEGWAEAFRDLLDELWTGLIPSIDYSQIRPAGARLKTFGGRASGPEPLQRLFDFAINQFKIAAGRALTPIEAHDLMCYVGDVVVSGGVRRSALISLSDLSDQNMATAKSGAWWEKTGHRRLANNSAVYMNKPTPEQFEREWNNLIESQSGERGIYNLAGARDHATAQGRDGSRIDGTNPCGEILLRNMEFCNLTEVVIDPDDTMTELIDKVRIAAIIGTWQSTLVDFQHLRPQWRENCVQERLLGVSLTGIYGHPVLSNPDAACLPEALNDMRQMAHITNQREALKAGIAASAAITCVKPSGTVSQLTGVSSGIHPWHAKQYIRTVRGNNTDPLTKMMTDYGVPHEPDIMKPDTTTVFSFPVKAPAGATIGDDITALEHLKLWALYRKHWTDHNPSITVSVLPEEWAEVADWVYENWDAVGGISFLPKDLGIYQQAPYQPCDEVTYARMVKKMPEIDWTSLSFYEQTDSTTSSQELACTAGACEIVDIASVPAVGSIQTLQAISA